MNQPEIRIYTGKIKEWTRDIQEDKIKESICGRRLLAYGLWVYRKDYLPKGIQNFQQLCSNLEDMIEKGVHGKPYFKKLPHIHFNISHSGIYGACAIAPVSCGLDIQEVKEIRNKRIFERVLSEKEKQYVGNAENPQLEFFKFWTRKESFLKLTGEGITRSLNDLEPSDWFEEFSIEENLLGCVAASCECNIVLQNVSADAFFEMRDNLN